MALAALSFFYLYQLNGVGILSTDEPRYAAIGRAMAESGDWITPRLWGELWFEKSPLLYWMTAIATRLGVAGEAAGRGPVALASIGFLAFLWRWMRRQFGESAAWFTCILLSTSAGWISYSFVAVTDLPMSVALAIAVLLTVQPEQKRFTPLWAGAWLGLALLAKGLVPLVLFAPLFWIARHRILDLAFGCVAVAAPWYVACYAANGQPFLTDFIWKHHVLRFFSDTLQHGQPFWFYIPVLLAGLFPWTPALFALGRTVWDDERLRMLVIWITFSVLFFTVAKNKLPGYVLPVLPGMAVVVGVALARAKNVAGILSACAALLLLLPVIAITLPEALQSGLTKARLDWSAIVGMPLVVVGVVALSTAGLASLGRREWAAALIGLAVAAGVTRLKVQVFPILDEKVSVRQEFERLHVPANQVCAGEIHRARLYGFSYYFHAAIPECDDQPRPVVLSNEPVRK